MTGLPPGATPLLHDLARLIAKVLYRPAYRIRAHHADRVPRKGSVVVIANHSTMIEPQLIFGMLPRRSVFLVKQEMFRGRAGFWLRRLGQVPVRRGEPDRTPLLDAVRVLREGGLVGVFPEGTRGAGDVEHAEQGAAWLVRSSGAVVVPVACRGTRRPEGVEKRRFRPDVDVLFGEPFTVTVPRGRSGLAEATEVLRGKLAATVAELDDMRAGASCPGAGRRETQ